MSYSDRILAVGKSLGVAIKRYNGLLREWDSLPDPLSPEEEAEFHNIINKATGAENAAESDFSSDDDEERQEQSVAKLERACEMINEAIADLTIGIARRRRKLAAKH
jgi:hypothetical protein